MSAEEKLDVMLAQLNEILDRLPPAVASPQQIRGKYGDPKINFDPKVWKGPSFKGSTASQASSEFLEVYAETLEYMAGHPKADSDPKFIGYNRRDAKLCRRWAIEMRSGKASPPKRDPENLFADEPGPEPSPSRVDDEIPF